MRKTIVTDLIMGDQPFRFGAHDAASGNLCVPEEFFASPDCIVHYTLGYVSVAGESETTRQLLAIHDNPEINKELTPVEWQRYLRLTDTWFFVTEDEVRELLTLSNYFGIDEVVALLRHTPDSTLPVRDGHVRYHPEGEDD